MKPTRLGAPEHNTSRNEAQGRLAVRAHDFNADDECAKDPSGGQPAIIGDAAPYALYPRVTPNKGPSSIKYTDEFSISPSRISYNTLLKPPHIKKKCTVYLTV